MADELDRLKEMRRDIYALRRTLRRDIRDVRNLAKVDYLAPKKAVEQMAEIERTMREKSVSKMDEKELQSTLRTLQHIRGLKTSTHEGAVRATENLISLVPNIRDLTPRQVKKLWSTYDKLVEELGILQKFKYELYRAIGKVVEKSRMQPDEIALKVEELYKQSQQGKLDKDAETDIKTKLLIQSFDAIL